ncbi:MFS transporter [Solirubrobacter sp. CPCC 204708]|uniref:MFS transporter n=1 Tax=Solirubrobacter deserti TaxID=2282478 RepID=A0ABT4RCJ6_9ACTN|nr:MFS transporter [Solirubrobacter deserti]MBE2315623.1 MFS transporter [Solirubrobacter deserti]MDA0136262.1 MFS transporter [Solirubrobacter deserti]
MSLSRATRAVYAVFILSGFAFANWASRIPQVRDNLELSPRSLGLVLLAIAVGSVISMPLAGVVVSRFGAARTIAIMALVAATGLITAGLGQTVGVLPVVIGLFLFGAGNGTWDVAMNVEGSAVEQQLGKAIMPRFHAGFSVGTVAGALIGSGMIAVDVSPAAHLLGVAALIAVAAPYAVRDFLAAGQDEHAEASGSPLKAWTEPRTLLIGVFVFAAAFTEGTGIDWLAVATIDGYDAAAALGSFTFALFLAAMTLGRWFGPAVLDRYGRVLTLRALGITAVAGLALVVWGGSLPVAMAGAVLWGLGASLGFPVGMSAASDDPRLAAGRVSVVATLGYVAFLAGPPLIGFLADETGTLRALTAAGGLVALGLLVSGALRPGAMSSAVPGRLISEPTERSPR